MIAGHVRRSVRVVIHSEAAERTRNFGGCARSRSFKEHMLDKVRQTVLVGIFVAAPRANHDARRNAFKSRHRTHNHAQTARVGFDDIFHKLIISQCLLNEKRYFAVKTIIASTHQKKARLRLCSY